jgi:hypothetical protein
MKTEQKTRPGDEKRSAAAAGAVMPVLLSVPVWDITDEQIEEWKHSCSGVPGVRLAGYTAASIRDGRYDSGKELFPLGSPACQEVDRATVDRGMEMLAERGMVRKSGGGWYPVVPGRMEPSLWRAVGTLLDRRADLPPALAAELESWKRALYALNAPGGTPGAPGGASAGKAAVVRTLRPARPTLAVAVGQ